MRGTTGHLAQWLRSTPTAFGVGLTAKLAVLRIFVQFEARVAHGLVLSVSVEDGNKFVGQLAVTFALGKFPAALRCCDGIVESTGFGIGRS